MSAPVVEVRDLRVRYGADQPWVVDGVSFSVAPGEVLVLLGPSGSGKTTTLRVLGGFEQAEAGEVFVGGRPMRGVPAERRGVGFVFQEYALFPHLTVAENIGFGLRRLPPAERRERVEALLRVVELGELAGRRPGALSGGQQQRVALARAVAPSPAVLLLDEPFSNLDAALRDAVRARTLAFLRDQGMCAVFVTHDQREALSVGDRVAVMNGGRIEQIGAPEEIYGRPRSAFVAGFLGRTNLLDGEAAGDAAETPLGRIAITRAATGRVRLSLRPHDLRVGDAGCPAQVVGRTFYGDRVLLDVRAGEVTLTVEAPGLFTARPGDTVHLAAAAPAVVLEG